MHPRLLSNHPFIKQPSRSHLKDDCSLPSVFIDGLRDIGVDMEIIAIRTPKTTSTCRKLCIVTSQAEGLHNISVADSAARVGASQLRMSFFQRCT